MIRLVGYLIADASMPHAQNGWYTIYEPPPSLSASQALERLAARLRTWEARLKTGSYRGTARVAIEASSADFTEAGGVRVLEVRAREDKPS